MNQLQPGSFESIPLSAIRPSTTNPRKHFDPAALEELTGSIRECGVTVPILVRSIIDEWPEPDSGRDEPAHYELVTGERRYRAAQAAGLSEIPAIVHDGLSDSDAMDLQLVENLQRADLHPVEEAEGYRALLAHGATAEDVAKKAGKTLGYVQQRLKLLTLEVDAKGLFAAGHLTLGHALLLARLTAKDQINALVYLLGIAQWEIRKEMPAEKLIATRMQRFDAKHMRRLVNPTAVELGEWIRDHVLLQLKGVPWDLGDADLLPIAGPCTTCPKRTGANAALFADLTTVEDTCVDPACFADKQKAFTLLAQARAKDQGSPLLKISSKHSTEKLEKPVVEIRASAVKLQQGKAVETARAVVVANKAVKEGQWVGSKKGACPATVQAIAHRRPGPGQAALRVRRPELQGAS
ncbi:MAG TPA: ParB/RepB/Spo0J family partition protein, partial [Acidobacteriaceae bacterium]|nr:ParB/RepB/Spo0J family partition protein [Acidobacteriaceae bacterium]